MSREGFPQLITKRKIKKSYMNLTTMEKWDWSPSLVLQRWGNLKCLLDKSTKLQATLTKLHKESQSDSPGLPDSSEKLWLLVPIPSMLRRYRYVGSKVSYLWRPDLAMQTNLYKIWTTNILIFSCGPATYRPLLLAVFGGPPAEFVKVGPWTESLFKLLSLVQALQGDVIV